MGNMVAQNTRTGHPRSRRPAWPTAALVAVGVWAMVTPYVAEPLGLAVPVAPRLEVIDHVVPGVVVVAVGLLAIRRRAPLAAALVVVLAGLWMVATHLPLLADAAAGVVATASAVWHIAPGVAAMALGGLRARAG